MAYDMKGLLSYALTGCAIAVLIIVSVSFFAPQYVYETPTPLVEVPPSPTPTPTTPPSSVTPTATPTPAATPTPTVTSTPKVTPMETLNTGILSIMITDTPLILRNLNLTIDHFEVCNSEGEWFEIPVNRSVAYFDLLKLQNITKEIAVCELPVGNYTMVKMKILHANATLISGETLRLRVSGVFVDASVNFEVENGLKTIVILDIDIKVQTPILGSEEEVNPTVTATVIPPS